MDTFWQHRGWQKTALGVLTLLAVGLLGLGLYALQTAPALWLKTRADIATLSAAGVIRIEDIPLPPSFFLRLPEFFTPAAEREWWTLQERVYDLLRDQSTARLFFTDHEGRPLEWVVPVRRLALGALLKRTGLIYLVALLYVLSAFFVFTHHRSPPGVVLTFFFMACALYFLCSAPVVQRSVTLPPFLFKVLVTCLYIAAGGLIALAHFALIFPTPKAFLRQHPWSLGILYGYFAGTVLTYLVGLTAFGTTFPLFCLWIGVIVWAFLHSLFTETDPFLRKQINLSLTAPVFAGLFAIFYLLPGALGLPPVPLTYFALLSLIIPYALPFAMDTRLLYQERLALEQRQRMLERQAQEERLAFEQRQRMLEHQAHAEQEQLRKNLHDLVLNNLAVIFNALEEMLRFDQEPKQLKERLQGTHALTVATSQQLRNFLAVTDVHYHSWEAFSRYLREWGHRLVEPMALQFEFESRSSFVHLPPPSPRLRFGLSCIWREVISNAIQHAQPTQIRGCLTVCAHTLVCEIHDDGVGMDSSNDMQGHYGFTNIQQQVTELGGTFTFITGVHGGTRFICHLPVSENTAFAG